MIVCRTFGSREHACHLHGCDLSKVKKSRNKIINSTPVHKHKPPPGERARAKITFIFIEPLSMVTAAVVVIGVTTASTHRPSSWNSGRWVLSGADAAPRLDAQRAVDGGQLTQLLRLVLAAARAHLHQHAPRSAASPCPAPLGSAS